MKKEDFSIYGRLEEANVDITKALEGFTIISVKHTYDVKRHYFDDDTGKEDIYEGYVEGGLTLILTNGIIKKKVILGYTELGEWLEHEEVIE